MTEEEKIHYQKRSAYVVWMLKKHLPKSIASDDIARKEVHGESDPKDTNNPNNLIAVQMLTKKGILDRIKALEKEYDSGEYEGAPVKSKDQEQFPPKPNEAQPKIQSQ